MPLQWQTVHVPLAAGLATKTDARALDPPGMLVCKNAQFTEQGGIQKRYPYTSYSAGIFGGGTLSDIRRIYGYGDELLCFTKDSLYSYSSRDSAWVLKGTHLGAKIAQRDVFVRTTEQSSCDRAELSGVIFYTWSDRTDGERVYVGAIDKTTGAVLLGATDAGGADTTSPRLVALGQKVLLFYRDKTNADLLVKSLDPSSIASSAAAAATTVASTEFDVNFDCCKLTSSSAVVVWRRTTTTSYAYATVTDQVVVSANTKARTCTGGIAVAVTADGTKVAVVRGNGTNVQGDILDSSLADVSTGAAVGTITTGVVHVGCEFRSVQNGGQYRCYAFWDNGAAQPSCEHKTNYIDTSGAVGTQAAFVYNTHVFAKPFDYGGSIFVWVLSAPDSVEQRSYLLYRDDGQLVAKAAAGVAGDHVGSTGITGSQNTGTGIYSFCGNLRRVVVPSGARYYSDGAPVDITVEFDSNEARRVVQLGRTLYVSGGQVKQYDGEQLVELGFHVYPQKLLVSDAAAGSLAAASYNWKTTYGWENAKGERERSTTTKITTTAIAASRKAGLSLEPLTTSLKRATVFIELWRTIGDAATGSAFYLASDKDPSQAGATDNPFYFNSPTTLGYQSTSTRDNMVDATLITKEASPENGDVLESIAPSAATIVAANHERLFLAGIPGDPYAVWPSKVRNDDELAAFHEALIVRLPATGGDITALAFLNNTLIVFKESAIYALPGDGFDNTGAGQNFGPPQLIAADVGARSADVVATTSDGLVFLSSKGWFLLNRGWSAQYIGAPIADYDTDTFSALHVLESKHEIRCFSTSRVLMLDTDPKTMQWSEWEIVGSHACIYNGTYHYCTSSTVYQESTSYSSAAYSLQVRLAPVKLAGLVGYQRVRNITVLGEYRSAHRLKIELFRDYNETAFQTKTWTVSPTTAGDGEIVRHGPSIQKVAALSVQLTDRDVAVDVAPGGEALKLTGIAFEVGIKKGPLRLPAAQKQ